MTKKKRKHAYTPRLILYLAVKNYLTDEQFDKLVSHITEKSKRSDLEFINIIKKHFDIELFNSKPYIWQDIWLYNYLMYEVTIQDKEGKIKTKLKRTVILDKYEDEILIPQNKILSEAKEIIGILNA
jgi:hypothetical protein